MLRALKKLIGGEIPRKGWRDSPLKWRDSPLNPQQ